MKNFYVTTSIPYANAEPHIGFAMEAIQADVLARYHEQRGVESRFQTGTDEHGVKLAKTAAKLGKTPTDLANENAQKFQALKEILNLRFDDFIRTTDQKRHWPAAQKLWQKLTEAGKLEKRKYKGLYCSGCEEFKREKDLVDGKCSNHKMAPEKVEEENWFFRLSDFSEEIRKLIESKKVEIVPGFRAKEFLNVLTEGLHDVSFSRPKKSLEWGIPVPADDSQVMYVWCDALTNYISAVDYANEGKDFQKWWSQSTEKVHVIGKDIVRFHAGIWIGMLLAAKLPLPDKIYVHGFITAEGQKMSKSLGNVLDPNEVTAEWGADALRYYLLSEIPNGQDGDFSKTRFEEIYNSHLANGLGNLVSRVVTMGLKIENNFQFKTLGIEREKKADKLWERVTRVMEEYDFRKALGFIKNFVDWNNELISTLKPWEKEGDEQKAIVGYLLENLRQIALAINPFLPQTSEKIAKILGVSLEGKFEEFKKWGAVKEFKLTKPGILFPKKG
ncbi:MAG: methionine--tRNA ligase [Patescibacteria group bacterium]